MISFDTEVVFKRGSFLVDNDGQGMIAKINLNASVPYNRARFFMAIADEFNVKVAKDRYVNIRKVQCDENDKLAISTNIWLFSPICRDKNKNKIKNAFRIRCVAYLNDDNGETVGDPEYSFENIKMKAETCVQNYVSKFFKWQERAVYRYSKKAANIEYEITDLREAITNTPSSLPGADTYLGRTISNKYCRYMCVTTETESSPIHKTSLDPLMKKFHAELQIIKKAKQKLFIGVPAIYIIPRTNARNFARQLINFMFESKLCLSRTLVEYESLYSHRGGDSVGGLAPLERILNATNILINAQWDFTADDVLKVDPTNNTVSDLETFFNTYTLKHGFRSSTFIFATDNKEEEDTIKKVLNRNGLHCRALLPDNITSLRTCKMYLNSMARKRGFKKGYTGELNQGVYTYMELTTKFNDWCNEQVYAMTYKKADHLQVNTGNNIYDPAEKLSKMIGLTKVKQVVNEIIAQFKMQALLQERGVSKDTPCRHMCFYGNPGTAKTTVARLIGEILKKDGILLNGKFVEVGRSDLIAAYVGQTAIKTKQKIDEAKGGILFIDEAYSLVESKGMYGDEAINTIVQMMDIVRDNTIIIFAGYPEKMEEFLDKNEGLRSRIAFHVKFDNYSVSELIKILKIMAKEKNLKISDEAITIAKDKIKEAIDTKDFGNGRFIRNMLERTSMKHAVRIINKNVDSYKNLSTEELTTLSEADVKEVDMSKRDEHGFMGFRL